MGRIRLSGCLLLLAAGVVGCTHKNDPLKPQEFNTTRAALGVPIEPLLATTRPSFVDDRHTTAPIADADGVFFGVAISGGGSRSANFAAAAMFDLQRLGLLQRVDYISSVSGGSLTAAYYCLASDKEWTPRNLRRRMTHSFATDILIETLIPWNWIFLTFSDWDRSDLLADSFRKHLFTREGHELTFKHLRDDRPRLLINATDLQTGKPFVF